MCFFYSRFKIVEDPGLDVFGQPPVIKKFQDCICPSCNRGLAASRFAPHLEKCMGMGRNSSRIASRRIANNSKETRLVFHFLLRNLFFTSLQFIKLIVSFQIFLEVSNVTKVIDIVLFLVVLLLVKMKMMSGPLGETDVERKKTAVTALQRNHQRM